MRQAVADADYVITQFAPVNAQAIQSMRRAHIIVRYGIGVDNVDLDAAKAANIPVCNVPDYCIDEVADQTLAFILTSTRQIVAHAIGARKGEWKLATPLAALCALKDRTVGVVGFGRIGREVVRRLVAFKAKVLIYDPVVPANDVQAAGAITAPIDRLLADSDIITLHCPSNAKTRKLINADSLAKTKRGFTLVNVGRGDLVDTAALVEALKSGQVGMAMLDVCDPEPVPATHPLLKFEQVIMSAHMASASLPAVTRLRESVAKHVLRALRGEPLVDVVNGVNTVPKSGS